MPRESLADGVLDPVRRIVGWLVSLLEVTKMLLRVGFMMLPILGPLGLIAWNMDWKPRGGGGSSFDISQYTGFWKNTFGNLGQITTVMKVAAGMARNGAGDIPDQPKEAGMAGKLTMGAALQGLRGPADGDGVPDAELSDADEQELLKFAGAPAKPIPKPGKKLSPAAAEAAELKEVLAAFEAARVDFRLHAQATSAFGAFATHFPKSKQRQSLRQKLDDLGRLRDSAMAERVSIAPDSKLHSLKLGAREARAIQTCLAALPRVRSVALARKDVSLQANVPAYFVVADVDWPVRPAQAEAATAASEMVERQAISKSLNACFAQRQKAGSLATEYWTPTAEKALLGAPDALVFVRS